MVNYAKIKEEAKKCLKCKNPLCVKGCPLSNPIPDVLKLIDDDKIDEACTILFGSTNSSIICSRLCDFNRQCAGNCILNKKNDPVLFYQVEEYLSKYFKDYIKICNKINKKVAIIGSGISGLSCAIDLKKKGYDVVIYEQNCRIGGVLTDTMPNFRFDIDLVKEYEKILEILEIKVFFNQEFGKNLKLDDLKDYDAIILAMGTMKPKTTLGESIYLLNPLDVLRDYNDEKLFIKNKNVLIIGGGNVAMDASRAIKRNGNLSTVVYRRDMENAPSSKKEINEAIEDGVKFIECAAPVEMIFENDVLVGLKVEKMLLEECSESSRKMFKKTGEFFEISADYIVEAIGLDANYDYLKANIPAFFNEAGWIIDDGYIKYNSQYIMATGDYFIGASTFVKATAQAKKTIAKLEELLCK